MLWILTFLCQAVPQRPRQHCPTSSECSLLPPLLPPAPSKAQLSQTQSREPHEMPSQQMLWISPRVCHAMGSSLWDNRIKAALRVTHPRHPRPFCLERLLLPSQPLALENGRKRPKQKTKRTNKKENSKEPKSERSAEGRSGQSAGGSGTAGRKGGGGVRTRSAAGAGVPQHRSARPGAAAPLGAAPSQPGSGRCGRGHFPFLPSKSTRTLPTSLSARAGVGPPEGGAAARGTLRTETTQNHSGQIHTDAHPRCSPRRPARNRAATTQSAKLVLLPVPAPPRFFSPN